MTKLPKGLEKLRDENAQQTYHGSDLQRTAYRRGFDAGALEVLQRAEKLAEALEAMINAAKDNNCGLRIADEALSDWQTWKENVGKSSENRRKRIANR